MAEPCIHLDSFDGYATADLPLLWDLAGSSAPTLSTGRNGNGLSLNGGSPFPATATDNLPATYSHLYVGFAMSPGSHSGEFFSFRDNGTEQCHLELGSDGSLVAKRGVTVLASAAPTSIKRGGFLNYVAINCHFSTGGTGSIVVKVNGVTVLSVAAVTNCATANAYATQVRLQGGVSTWTADDYYVSDATGTGAALWTDIAVEAKHPNANGHLSTMSIGGSAPAATAWQSVLTPEDGDVTYVFGGVGDAALMKVLPPNSGDTGVLAIQAVNVVRIDSSGARTVATVISDGVSDTVGPDKSLTTAYEFIRQGWTTNPNNGGAVWSLLDAANVQVGIEVTS